MSRAGKFAYGVMALALLCAVILWGEMRVPSAAGAESGGAPVWGEDIIVNPTLTPAPYRYVQRNFNLAMNPLDPTMILAAYDAQVENFIQSAYAVSRDSGLTWDGAIMTDLWGDGLQPIGDVSIAYDSDGTGYYLGLAVGNLLNGHFILTTTNGLDWSEPVPVFVDDYGTFRRNATLAIDRSPTSPYEGRIYTTWTLYTSQPYSQSIELHYSDDKGVTWSSGYQVSDGQYNFATGPSFTIAPDGTLYSAYMQQDNYYVYGPYRLLIDKSTDGGRTWGRDNYIGGAPITHIGRPDWKGRELVLAVDGKCNIMRVFHYPYIAASKTDSNTVYAVWNDGRWDSEEYNCANMGQHADIAFSRTTDGGVTWSTPIRLNDDTLGNGVDQFHPTMSVREDGLIGVTWLDRRYSTNGFFYDVSYTQSTDGGLTWSANQRVSDVSNDPNPAVDYKTVDDLGFKSGLLYMPGYVIASWIKTYTGTAYGDFAIDRGVLKVLTPTATAAAATPSRTATSVATGTAIATATACTLSFTDVPTNHTFYANIRCLACRGIISGYADGTFKPGNNITRGQITKMVSNAAGFNDPVSGQTYADVLVTDTFYEWIERLTAESVMGGYACGGPGEPCDGESRPYFRPGANATRGQLSKIVANAAGYNDPAVGQFYADVLPTNTFYTEIMRLTNRGVMSGYACGGVGEPCDVEARPYFRPGFSVTRGQASKIVANTFYPECVTP